MTLKEMILISIFAALTAIFAQIIVPLPVGPVPITLQVLAVCLASAILGSRLAIFSQLIYISLGLIGMPVFSGGAAGPAQIMGPTGGYIIGFLPAAFVIGKIVERKPYPTSANTLLAMLCGLSIIYSLGMLQLALVTGITVKAAFISGVIPFLGMDLIKIVLGATVACSVRTVLIKQKLLDIPN